MCGIAGILLANQSSEVVKTPEVMRHLKKMTDSLAHRGPDGEGCWHNETGHILLGHRRLSVIDLSGQAKGSYLLRITTGESSFVRKIIVE